MTDGDPRDHASGQVRAAETSLRLMSGASDGQLDDVLADIAEVVPALGTEDGEEADGREARDGVDLGQVQLAAAQQEVDAGEAARADGQVRLARELTDSVADGCRELRPVGRTRDAGLVFRLVVVELVAGE